MIIFAKIWTKKRKIYLIFMVRILLKSSQFPLNIIIIFFGFKYFPHFGNIHLQVGC